MIFTGTSNIMTAAVITDAEGHKINDWANPVTVAVVDCNFQNKPTGELKFSMYGLSDIDDNKYVFTDENPEIQLNRRMTNNNNGKVYEIRKIFDGYPDGHIEIMCRAVVGE